MVEMDSIIAVQLIGTELDRSVYSLLIKVIRHVMGLHESCITHVFLRIIRKFYSKVTGLQSRGNKSSQHGGHLLIHTAVQDSVRL